jgi:hypothetical protein
MSQKKMKDNPIYWDDVVAQAKTYYHPGEQPKPAAALSGAR